MFFFTYLHDSSENRGVVHGAAVPAAVPELVLALLDAHLGAFTDVMDVVLVELTQLLLALRQAHQLAAQRLCADDVSLRDQQRVHGQRPAATGGGWVGGWGDTRITNGNKRNHPNHIAEATSCGLK